MMDFTLSSACLFIFACTTVGFLYGLLNIFIISNEKVGPPAEDVSQSLIEKNSKDEENIKILLKTAKLIQNVYI